MMDVFGYRIALGTLSDSTFHLIFLPHCGGVLVIRNNARRNP